jgi:membrane associated rhomboid family serine protease
MFALYMFGLEIERLLGSKRFLTYITWRGRQRGRSAAASAAHDRHPPVPTVGASGIFGLAYGMAFPRRKLMLIFPDPDARLGVRDAVRSASSCTSGLPAAPAAWRTSRTWVAWSAASR